MKFGKTYLETLNGPRIPAEWRQTAIEYRKLKKVINRVASELAELGLTSDVLKDLLEAPPDASEANESSGDLRSGEVPAAETSRLSGEGEDSKGSATVKVVVTPAAKSVMVRPGREIEWDSSGEEGEDGLSVKAKGKRRGSRRRATASYELGGTSIQPEPRIRLIFESASSGDTLSSSSEAEHPVFSQQSSDTNSAADPRFTEVNSSEEDAAPQVDEEDDGSSQSSSTPKADFQGKGPKENALLKRVYGLDVHSDDERDWASMRVEVESRNDGGRRKSDETVRWQNTEENKKDESRSEAEKELPLSEEASARALDEATKAAVADEADDEGSSVPKERRKRHRPRRHRKEVFIPLTSETEFLTLLAKALDSLAALQVAQKQQFAQAVQLLAREVSNVSSPSRPKTDLYVWREIFSLWVEAQIFESEREKDRGERSVEDAEAKLDWFVNQVAKRKLGKKMKHKESRIALEKFISLNVELLDMKRFQLANEEAARKILKKHDKRTALTASLGFPRFIAAASTLSSRAGMTPDGTPSTSMRVLILPGFPSLPHMLLSTFTTTLLPIIPQLEDYECSICGDVAFKPIRLDCSHKFCVRCLVKMQKRGQDACPQCRQPVVLRASAQNLDHAMQQYLELWFPKEVKEKAKLNQAEAAKEELQAMGLEHKCVVQ
ncbi:E3 ubiquitin-protein ligase BAH, partial [Phenoliferia sp. Uapishka_3]